MYYFLKNQLQRFFLKICKSSVANQLLPLTYALITEPTNQNQQFSATVLAFDVSHEREKAELRFLVSSFIT